MNKTFVVLSILYAIFMSNSFAAEGNTKIKSFGKAKKILSKLYQQHRVTFYCGCDYKKKEVDHSSCGYKPKRTHYKSGKKNKRAYRIEWEHVVPAHAFGQSFKEWRHGDPKCVSKKGKPFKGRKCAGKINRKFKHMEADLYNLVPAIGEVNGNRSNYSMAIIPGEKRNYGNCDVEIEGRKVEPTEGIRGNIARTYLYMDSVYPRRGIISKKNRKLFDAWNKSDPVDDWECKRARLIEKIQGNENPFVKEQCEK
jgi:deoxyribonuclease I